MIGRSFQAIGCAFKAFGKFIAAQCLFLIGIIILLGPPAIGIIASAYMGGVSGAYITRELLGKGWWLPISAFVGFGLVLTFLQNYVFWPHMWPAIEKSLDVLKKAIGELQDTQE